MIGIFNRKRIKELEKRLESEVEKRDKKFLEMTDKLTKLERIIKYAKDDIPSFRIDRVPQYRIFEGVVYEFDLYLYINKQEYIIGLDELITMHVVNDSAKLEVKDGIATFTIDYNSSLANLGTSTGIFIIDYRKNAYIFQHIEKESPNVGDEKEE